LGESEDLIKEESAHDKDTEANLQIEKEEQDAPASPEPSTPTIRKATYSNHMSPDAKAALHTHDLPKLSSSPCPAPAARIRLTVSSGFYVRSFAHDLGLAVGSMGMMASLVRSRQAEFTSDADETGAKRALTYEELEGGEEVWGPRVENMMEEYTKMHPPTREERQKEREGTRDFARERRGGGGYQDRGRRGGGRDYGRDFDRDRGEKRRRNSSSPD
jgi:tRNA pseudouridine55 synthase